MSLKEHRILIAETGEDILHLIEERLKRFGIFEIDTVSNGGVAYDKLNESLAKGIQYDFVISEKNLPGQDGLDLLDKLRSHKTYSKIPFLLLSDESSPNTIRRAMRLNVNGFVIKPLETGKLDEALSLLTKLAKDFKGTSVQEDIASSDETDQVDARSLIPREDSPKLSAVERRIKKKKRPLLLLATHQDDFRELTCEMLSDLDYDVIIAPDGKQALEKFYNNNPDLVIVDIGLPEVSGPEVCKIIKNMIGKHFVPVLLSADVDDLEHRITGIEAGADSWVLGPFRAYELRSKCYAMLRIKELHDSLEETQKKLREMNETLEAKVQEQVKKIDAARHLARYLAPNVVKSIMEGDQKEEFGKVPKRRTVTSMFCDVRNFTQLADEVEPIQVKEFLDEFLELVTEVVFRHEGTINKFMGDGVLVIFGDPIVQADHSLRAMKAALEIQEKAREIQEKAEAHLHRHFSIGIGIHTGPVVIGNVGKGGHIDYTAIGSSVNLAARLQSFARHNEVIASKATFEPYRDKVFVKHERSEDIKGFSDGVEIGEISDVSSVKKLE